MSYRTPLASNTDYGLVKAGTGVTITDGTLSASTGLLNYGFFSDGTQTNPVASQVNTATFSVTGPTNGTSIVGGTQVTVANAGVYTALFTTLVAKTSGGTSSVSIWFRYNGTDVVGSRQDLELTNTLATIFTSGNYTITMAANSNLELCWSSADTTVSLLALPAAVTPTRPSGASLKFTLTRIS